jgi:hypothetical protein
LTFLKEDLATILSGHFDGKRTFTKAELEAVLKDYYNKPYHETTYRWRIYDLKDRGIIQNIGRGIYAFPNTQKIFQPLITPEAVKLYEDIRKSLPYTNIALTDTTWYNEFMIHQVFKTYIVINVEKDTELSVFNSLPAEYKQSYINPRKEIFDFYIPHVDQPVIINSMISESPLSEINGIMISSLEKLLVDLVSDELLYTAQQEERAAIFENAHKKYFLNLNKLRRYARRRNRIEQMEELIKRTEAK